MSYKKKYILPNVISYFKATVFNIKSPLIILLLTVGCGQTQMDLEDHNLGSGSIQLSPEDRAEIVTNELFEALIDGYSIEQMDALISTSRISVRSANKRGDTILGVAIQFQKKEVALFLVGKYTCEDLSHQNNKGESYIYLSAEYGYEQLIHGIANKCFEEDPIDFSDYEFSDLDLETKEENIAIHIARNAAVAKALDYEYTRGVFERSWFAFHTLNKNEESFLHKAVQDNRINVVEWAVHTYCDKGEWEQSGSWWFQQPVASVVQHLRHGIQSYTINFEQLVNYQDIHDNTALHVAARLTNTRVIRLLSGCRWMDFLLENEDENIALQVFLSSLDETRRNHTQDVKEAFLALVHAETYLAKWFINISDTVDHQNKERDSSLHISARLADPYFYNYLKQYADIRLRNNSGISAEEIFSTTEENTKGL